MPLIGDEKFANLVKEILLATGSDTSANLSKMFVKAARERGTFYPRLDAPTRREMWSRHRVLFEYEVAIPTQLTLHLFFFF
jgi:hypothetical protein